MTLRTRTAAAGRQRSVHADRRAWYENPGWRRHVLASGLNRSINAAARDLDDDGIPEIAVAHEFGTTHASSLGILSLLTHMGDPTESWRIREVDRTPTVHRIRWADADGTGRPVLVSAPLSGPAAEPPEYRDAVPVDLVCIGGRTANLEWYERLAVKRATGAGRWSSVP